MATRSPSTGWANRIAGGKVHLVDPADLLANPLNARRHPGSQRDALRAALDIGWVMPVVVNRITEHLLDGHARVEEALSKGAAAVPVIYVDLSEDEERALLLVLDPISGMATYDGEVLDKLAAGLTLDGPLAELAGDLDAMWPADQAAGLLGTMFGGLNLDDSPAESTTVLSAHPGANDPRRVLAIPLSLDDHKYVLGQLRRMQEAYGVDTQTEAFMRVVRAWRAPAKRKA
jgi:hypothetical protein